MKPSLSIAVLALALASATPSTAFAVDLLKGQTHYNMHCASCHGMTGMPVLPNVPNFAKRERLEQPDFVLLQSVKIGKSHTPPFLGILKDDEITNILQYIRTLR